MISFIKNDEGITAVIDGKPYTITADNPSYGQVVDAIKGEEPSDVIADLFNQANAVKRYSDDQIDVTEYNELRFQGEPIHNVVVDRIFSFMSEGLPFKPLLAFLKRLLANPSKRSIEELYTFLEHKNLPITEDGCFLAYKGVRDDYLDVHSGKFLNSPGAVHSMLRNKVDDDFRNGCSYGFHVGSLEYATHWGQRTVIVKVDPSDVVSVPSDCECQKLRTSKYEVLCDYKGPLPKSLHSDEPYEDEEEDYDYYPYEH